MSERMTEQEFLALEPREQDEVIAPLIGWNYVPGALAAALGSLMWLAPDDSIYASIVEGGWPAFGAMWEAFGEVWEAALGSTGLDGIVRIWTYAYEPRSDTHVVRTIGGAVHATAPTRNLAVALALARVCGIIEE